MTAFLVAEAGLNSGYTNTSVYSHLFASLNIWVLDGFGGYASWMIKRGYRIMLIMPVFHGMAAN